MAKGKAIRYQGTEYVFDKALELVQRSAEWVRYTEAGRCVAYGIESGSRPGVVYRVTPTACDCPAGLAGRTCYHRTAVALYVEARRAGAPSTARKSMEIGLGDEPFALNLRDE